MGGHRAFPREIFDARDTDGSRFTLGARLTLSALWSFARWWDDDEDALWVFPAGSTLGRITGQDRRSVRRHTSALARAGLIVREKRSTPGGTFEGWRLIRPGTDRSGGEDTSVPRGEDRPVLGGRTDEPRGEDRPVLGGRTDRSPKEVPPKDPQQAPPEESKPPDHTDEVIAYMRDAVRELTGDNRSGPRATSTNRDIVRKTTRRESATLEDWQRVIDAQRDSVRGRPETWRYLCFSTITRPRNWARLMDAPASKAPNRSARHAPSHFENPEPREQTPWQIDDEIPL